MAKSFCPPAWTEIANCRVFFQIGSNFLTLLTRNRAARDERARSLSRASDALRQRFIAAWNTRLHTREWLCSTHVNVVSPFLGFAPTHGVVRSGAHGWL